MADTIVNLVKGDYGFNVNFTVKDENGSVINISGSTIHFKVAKPGAATSEIVFNGTCTIDNGPLGTCYYTVLTGDLDTAGMFNGELQIDYGNKIITDRTFKVIIRGDI